MNESPEQRRAMTIYDQYIETPPLDKSGNRSRGSSSKDAYWCGFDGGPKRGEKGSNSRLAWEAGRDARKAKLNRDRVQRHREKKREGLVKVEVWIRPENRERLLKYVKRL